MCIHEIQPAGATYAALDLGPGCRWGGGEDLLLYLFNCICVFVKAHRGLGPFAVTTKLNSIWWKVKEGIPWQERYQCSSEVTRPKLNHPCQKTVYANINPLQWALPFVLRSMHCLSRTMFNEWVQIWGTHRLVMKGAPKIVFSSRSVSLADFPLQYHLLIFTRVSGYALEVF